MAADHRALVSPLLPWSDTGEAAERGGDTLLIVADGLSSLPDGLAEYRRLLGAHRLVDKSLEDCLSVTVLPGGGKYARLVFAATGPLDRDYDDVRRYGDAARQATVRAIACGARRLDLHAVTAAGGRFADEHVQLVCMVAAASAAYVPIEVRECKGASGKAFFKLDRLDSLSASGDIVRRALSLVAAKTLYCDVGGADPERMTPIRAAEHVVEAFANSASVKVDVMSDFGEITREYPCLAAVNRCAQTVPRHAARVVRLGYEGDGPITDTLYLVGKGVTIDTGGVDVKTGGGMYGMSRDKLGAAAVAGFFKCAELARPPHIKLVGFMCLVRNSVGANAYTCDEIVTARSGQRIRIVNTDAEGRMAMLDPLCHAKEMALGDATTAGGRTHLVTLATLTGHAYLTAGEPYAIALDNGRARARGEAARLQAAGDEVGECIEVSRVRREDFDFHRGAAETEDLRQCGSTAPSSRTPRGHQGPMAFLQMGAGLCEPQAGQLKYTHVDFAGTEADGTGVMVGRPLGALAHRWLF